MGKRDGSRRWPPGVDDEIATTLDDDARRDLRRLAKRDLALSDALSRADRRRNRLAKAVAAGRKGRKRRRRLGAAEADVRAAAEDVLGVARSIDGPAAAYVWPSIAMAEGALAQLGESSLMHGSEPEDVDDLASALAADGSERFEESEESEESGRIEMVEPVEPASPLEIPPAPPTAEPYGLEQPVEPAPPLEIPPAPPTAEPWVPGSRSIVGAIDVGSNSVHVLVAALADHGIEPLVDESEFLGLGRAADAGSLGPALRARLVAAIDRYVQVARSHGADAISIIGTQPLRRSADAARVVAEIEAATGVPLHVLGHDEEALLTLLGATRGLPVTTDLALVDIGGGSSEMLAIRPGERASVHGLAVGSAALTDRHLGGDPPTPREVEILRSVVREALAAAPVLAMSELVAVGGTADNLVRLVPAAEEDRILTARRLDDALAVLLSEPSASIAERYVMRPERARILPAGAVILGILLEHYGLDRAVASPAGIREGLVRALGHAGDAWRDRLEALAHGWVD